MKIEKFVVCDTRSHKPDVTCQITWKGLNDYGAKINPYFGEALSLDELTNLREAIDTYLAKTARKAAKKQREERLRGES